MRSRIRDNFVFLIIIFGGFEMKKVITRIIDTFYFMFQSFLPLKTYRYVVCGGSNFVLDIFLFFIFYNFIFAKQNVDLYFVVLSPHIASLFAVFPITFTTGFLFSKYITFEYSNLPWKVQFFRYFIIGMGALILNYASMKFLIDFLGFYATPSRILTVVINVIYSYLLQNKYSFKVK